jgi:hypothetical protein
LPKISGIWLPIANTITAAAAAAVLCRWDRIDQINDLGEEYELGITAISLKEIIVEAMVIPNHMKLAPENED